MAIDPRVPVNASNMTAAQFRDVFDRSTVPVGLDAIFRPMTSVPPRPTAQMASLSDAFRPIEAGGSAPSQSEPSLSTNAPSFSLASQTQGVVDAMNQGMNQASLTGALGIPGIVGTLGNIGLAAATQGGSKSIGLTASALGALMGLAAYFGIEGGVPNAALSEAQLSAMNHNSPIDQSSFATLTQGLSIDPATLNAMNAKAPFGRGSDPDAPPPAPDPDPTGITADMSDPAGPGGIGNPGGGGATGGGPAGGGTGAGGGTAAGPSGDASDAEDRGGLIGRKPRPAVSSLGHVMVKALPSEYIVRPSETAKLLPALEDLNRPGVSPLERKVMEHMDDESPGLGRLFRRG